MFIGVVIGIGLFGCSGNIDTPVNPDSGGSASELAVSLSSDEYIDSAQVLFFRKLSTTDSLVYREVIYGIGRKLSPFKFAMPAGTYILDIYGNISPASIIVFPPYSRKEVRIDYSKIGEPPVVFRGYSLVNVGVDTLKYSSMMLLSSQVQLTIRDVPAGVDRLNVVLHNTSVGFDVLSGFIDKQMDPPLSRSIENVKQDSSYTVLFSCFPTVEKDSLSRLSVQGIGSTGKVLYSGISSPFPAQYGMRSVISCRFTKGPAVRSAEKEIYVLKWGYDEENL